MSIPSPVKAYPLTDASYGFGSHFDAEHQQLYDNDNYLDANKQQIDGWIPTSLGFARETAKDSTPAAQFCLSLSGDKSTLYNKETLWRWVNATITKYAILKDIEYVSADAKTYFFFFTGDDSVGTAYSLDASGAVSSAVFSYARSPSGFNTNQEKWKLEVKSTSVVIITGPNTSVIVSLSVGRGTYRGFVNAWREVSSPASTNMQAVLLVFNSTDSLNKMVNYVTHLSGTGGGGHANTILDHDYVTNTASGGVSGVKTYQLKLSILAGSPVTSTVTLYGTVVPSLLEVYGLI